MAACLQLPSSFWRLQRVVVIIESLKDSSGKSFLDVLDGSGLGDSGVSISLSFSGLSLGKLGLKGNKKLVFVHGFISFNGLEELSVMVMVVSGGNGGDEDSEFHL